MLTINCPACNRSLRAPAETGEQTVSCPSCGASFTVTQEAGNVRTQARVLTGAIRSEVGEDRHQQGQEEAVPGLVPTVARDVYHDDDARRTYLIHKTVQIVVICWLAVGAYLMTGNAMGTSFLGWAVALPVCCFLAVAAVGHILAPDPAARHPLGEKIDGFLDEEEEEESFPACPTLPEAGASGAAPTLDSPVEPPSDAIQPRGPQP